VCWRRVSTKDVKRGKLALCIRKDMEWLARGTPLQFDVEKRADCDIPDVIAAVRDYFRRHRTAFFDDVLEATGLDEDAVMRSVWYLAWCGELTCDTFECVRHADMQSTLSACYDLAHTPRKILDGRDTQERVIERMKKRKLDPRLGRWSATERLIPPKQPLAENDIIRKWAQQLLARWGIVSKDALDAEVAAPPWSILVRELKRLELLGEVSRGYFIESHQGEQYGLPEAIELLRDCRARRSDGKELGYLPDEPVFTITNRDPANLYTTSLDVIDDRGERFKPMLRQGNLIARLAIQAGQVLIYGTRQLTRLARPQLFRCVEQLTHDYTGRAVQTRFGHWNGYPIDVSPVAGLLWEFGFRFDKYGKMCWPASKSVGSAPPVSEQDVFLPYYAEPPPVEYGPAWTVSRAPVVLQPLLERLFNVIVAEFDRDGWELRWHDRGPSAVYRDTARMDMHIGRSFANVNVRIRPFREGEGRRRFGRKIRVTRPDEVNDSFIAELRAVLEGVEELADRYLALRRS